MVHLTLYLAVAGAALYAAWTIGQSLWANVQKARSVGLPYFVVPCLPFNPLWQATCHIWIPLIQLLPARFWQDWLFILMPDWGYRFRQAPFERLGDSFVVASPGGVVLFTQDAAAIHEMAVRREHFPKATVFYQVLEIFGRNLLTTEGAVWRLHRKVTSTSFNERNAGHTFRESVYQTQQLLKKWEGKGEGEGEVDTSSPTIGTVESDTMQLALHIIGYVGFGLRFLWPGETATTAATDGQASRPTNRHMDKYGSLEAPAGHSLTFAASVELVLQRILLLLVVPARLLALLPFRAAREAHEARTNYEAYMREFLAEKAAAAAAAAAAQAGDGAEGMDIMGQLVRSRATAGEDTAKDEHEHDHDHGHDGTLTDAEIVGNAFVMLVAGHETTANTLHFSLLELAAAPAAQRALQADIDRLLGRDSDAAAWDFEANIAALQTSMLAAAMNETLRLMPPVVNIPKRVAGPQVLAMAGRPHVLPADMVVILSVITVQRNPRYWGGQQDLDAFVPARWLHGNGNGNGEEAEPVDEAVVTDASVSDEDSLSADKASTKTTAPFLYPPRGAFVPFSDGARSCLGRRIAQVEMLAALAVLFQRHSLELAVDDWADDAAVARMTDDERRALYARAQQRARTTLDGATTLLTLKLHGAAAVPVRLVPRGQERFLPLFSA